jgi:hypothetical protein
MTVARRVRSKAPAEGRIDLVAEPVMLPGGAVKVDRAVAMDTYAVVAGWSNRELVFEIDGLQKLIGYERPDAQAQFGDGVVGFFAVIATDPDAKSVSFKVSDGTQAVSSVVPLDRQEEAIGAVLLEHRARLMYLLETLADSSAWGRVLLAQAIKQQEMNVFD